MIRIWQKMRNYSRIRPGARRERKGNKTKSVKRSARTTATGRHGPRRRSSILCFGPYRAFPPAPRPLPLPLTSHFISRGFNREESWVNISSFSRSFRLAWERGVADTSLSSHSLTSRRDKSEGVWWKRKERANGRGKKEERKVSLQVTTIASIRVCWKKRSREGRLKGGRGKVYLSDAGNEHVLNGAAKVPQCIQNTTIGSHPGSVTWCVRKIWRERTEGRTGERKEGKRKEGYS